MSHPEFIRRPPPHDDQAERSLLGAALLDPAVLDAVLVPDEAWYSPRCSAVWRTMRSLRHRDRPIDEFAVTTDLRRQGLDEQAVPDAFVDALRDAVLTPANASYFAEVILTCWRKRRVAEAAARTWEHACEPGASLEDVHVQAEARLLGAMDALSWDGMATADAFVEEGSAHADKLIAGGGSGFPTGYRELDRILGGLEPGTTSVVAARPSIGKTTFGLNLLRNLCLNGVPGGLVSLEMKKRDLALNLAFGLSHVDGARFRRGESSNDEYQAVKAALDSMRSWPIVVDDGANTSLDSVLSRCRAMATKHGCKVVVVDYAQLITCSAGNSEQERLTEASIQFTVLAKSLDVHLMLLAQINRDAAKSTNKVPHMHEIKGSGQFEQDAYQILLLHRPAFYEPENRDEEFMTRAEVIVEKNRNGRRGMATLTFLREHFLLEDRAPSWHPDRGRAQ